MKRVNHRPFASPFWRNSYYRAHNRAERMDLTDSYVRNILSQAASNGDRQRARFPTRIKRRLYSLV